jgi:hypothetical protein
MKALGVSLTMALAALWTQAAAVQADCGSPDRCAACRRPAACRKEVCQVVCEMKEVTKTYWCVECEPFCAPLPGCGNPLTGWLSGLLGCGPEHGSCQAAGGQGCEAEDCHGSCQRSADPPKCGPVHTRKKLVKKEYTCKVPVYTCVVRYVCAACAAEIDRSAESETEPTAAPAPLPKR